MSPKKDCIFCEIVAKNAPAEILLETDSFIVIPDINPSAQTHLLIIPKKHLESFLDIKKQDEELLIEMTLAAQKFVIKNKNKGAYKLIFNGGKYQHVRHLHWHLLGGKMKKRAV